MTRNQWKCGDRARRIRRRIFHFTQDALAIKMNPRLVQAYEECGIIHQCLITSKTIGFSSWKLTICGKTIELVPWLPIGIVISA